MLPLVGRAGHLAALAGGESRCAADKAQKGEDDNDATHFHDYSTTLQFVAISRLTPSAQAL